jgi:hypothetical protein
MSAFGGKADISGRLEVPASLGAPLQDSIAVPDNDALFEQAGTASWWKIFQDLA